MANTKIPVELSSTPGIVDNSNATAITIDSSENVGIGQTSPSSFDAGADNLVIGDTSDSSTGLTIASSSSGIIYFADGTTGDQAYRGAISYSHPIDSMIFRTGGFNERMRIDSSGNVGIGNTVASTIDAVNASGNLVVGSGSGSEGISVYSGNTNLGSLCFADGTSGTSTYTGYITYNHSSNHMEFGAGGGTERMRIDSSGRLLVGIAGTSDPDFGLFNVAVAGASTGRFHIGYGSNGDNYYTVGSSGKHVFRQDTGERMRINSSGQLLIGKTSAQHDTSGIEVEGSSSGGKGAVLFQGTGDNGPAINAYKTSTTTSSSARFIQFAANSGSTSMGAIVGNGASNVQFITLSDEREKENINPVVGALDKLMNLNVVSFDWKKNDEHVKAGFIAQNVEEHFPEYVIENVSNDGEEPRKGTTGGMSAGYIAVLTKAIQEQQTQIEALQSEINLLKGE